MEKQQHDVIRMLNGPGGSVCFSSGSSSLTYPSRPWRRWIHAPERWEDVMRVRFLPPWQSPPLPLLCLFSSRCAAKEKGSWATARRLRPPRTLLPLFCLLRRLQSCLHWSAALLQCYYGTLTWAAFTVYSSIHSGDHRRVLIMKFWELATPHKKKVNYLIKQRWGYISHHVDTNWCCFSTDDVILIRCLFSWMHIYLVFKGQKFSHTTEV